MRNIEIKARVADIESARKTAADLAGAGPGAKLTQVDTYFKANDGRLKLREEGGEREKSELIYYKRPRESGPKGSYYERLPVGSPNDLKRFLEKALGIKAVIRKRRDVYLFKNARIHLDEVEGLGSFLEIEVVMENGLPDSEGKPLLEELMQAFSISPEDLVAGSYCDLIE